MQRIILCCVQVMPLLLLVPQLMPMPPIGRVMMFGYGDVVVPGLMIALLRRFDVAVGRSLWSGYMLPCLAAYTAGIALTDLALAFEVFGSKGQPALMYLVPCTLGVTWLLAYVRGDCTALWTGRVDDWKDHASGSDEGDIEGQRDVGSASGADRRQQSVAALGSANQSAAWGDAGDDAHEGDRLLER